jgi:hypothetical protein
MHQRSRPYQGRSLSATVASLCARVAIATVVSLVMCCGPVATQSQRNIAYPTICNEDTWITVDNADLPILIFSPECTTPTSQVFLGVRVPHSRITFDHVAVTGIVEVDLTEVDNTTVVFQSGSVETISFRHATGMPLANTTLLVNGTAVTSPFMVNDLTFGRGSSLQMSHVAWSEATGDYLLRLWKTTFEPDSWISVTDTPFSRNSEGGEGATAVIRAVQTTFDVGSVMTISGQGGSDWSVGRSSDSSSVTGSEVSLCAVMFQESRFHGTLSFSGMTFSAHSQSSSSALVYVHDSLFNGSTVLLESSFKASLTGALGAYVVLADGALPGSENELPQGASATLRVESRTVQLITEPPPDAFQIMAIVRLVGLNAAGPGVSLALNTTSVTMTGSYPGSAGCAARVATVMSDAQEFRNLVTVTLDILSSTLTLSTLAPDSELALVYLIDTVARLTSLTVSDSVVAFTGVAKTHSLVHVADSLLGAGFSGPRTHHIINVSTASRVTMTGAVQATVARAFATSGTLPFAITVLLSGSSELIIRASTGGASVVMTQGPRVNTSAVAVNVSDGARVSIVSDFGPAAAVALSQSAPDRPRSISVLVVNATMNVSAPVAVAWLVNDQGYSSSSAEPTVLRVQLLDSSDVELHGSNTAAILVSAPATASSSAIDAVVQIGQDTRVRVVQALPGVSGASW